MVTATETLHAMLYRERLNILKLLLVVLGLGECKAGPNQDFLCPEVPFNVVVEKLAYTFAAFLNFFELLCQSFFQVRRGVPA